MSTQVATLCPWRVSGTMWHPGQAIIPTGYLPKINSYGPAHVLLRASTVGGAPGEPRRLSRPTTGIPVANLCPWRVSGTMAPGTSHNTDGLSVKDS